MFVFLVLNSAFSPQKKKKKIQQPQQLVGTWIAEVSVSMPLSIAIIDELASTLGISLDNIVISGRRKREGARRRRRRITRNISLLL